MRRQLLPLLLVLPLWCTASAAAEEPPVIVTEPDPAAVAAEPATPPPTPATAAESATTPTAGTHPGDGHDDDCEPHGSHGRATDGGGDGGGGKHDGEQGGGNHPDENCDTPTSPPPPTPPATAPVTPVFECVRDMGKGRYQARFGYTNPNHKHVTVAIGSRNRFSPAPLDRGQPSSFNPGSHGSAFWVSFSGGSIVWVLDGRSASASTGSRPCSGPPTCTQAGLPCTDIPELPNAAIGLGMGGLGALLGMALRRRRRPR